MTLFVAYVDLDDADPLALDFADAYFALRPNLYLVDTALSQSRLYHRIKRMLPPDTGLFVAALADRPKFKGMEDGALKWVRGQT